MSTEPDSGPFRAIVAVVAVFVVSFGFVLLSVQFGANAAGVLTLPLVVAIPFVAALLWYRFKRTD